MIFFCCSFDKNGWGSIKSIRIKHHLTLYCPAVFGTQSMQYKSGSNKSNARQKRKRIEGERRKTITIILRDVIRLYLSGSVSSCCLYGARGGGGGGGAWHHYSLSIFHLIFIFSGSPPHPKKKDCVSTLRTL